MSDAQARVMNVSLVPIEGVMKNGTISPPLTRADA